MTRSAFDGAPVVAFLSPTMSAGPVVLAVAVLALAAVALVLEAVRRRRHGR